jgi:hypothetical protein
MVLLSVVPFGIKGSEIMNMNYLLSGFILGVSVLTIFLLIYRSIMLRKIESLQSQAVLDDLELATKEQLLNEFRKRPNNSYILLLPMSNKDEQGIKIELNRFTPYDSVGLLHLATSLIFRQMKNKGMSLPELPSIIDED